MADINTIRDNDIEAILKIQSLMYRVNHPITLEPGDALDLKDLWAHYVAVNNILQHFEATGPFNDDFVEVSASIPIHLFHDLRKKALHPRALARLEELLK